MTARAVPSLPQFLAGQKLTASLLNQIYTWGAFWDDPPMFSMYQSIVQSIPNAADTQITMDLFEHDTDTGRSGASPYSYVIPVGMTGRWRFTACVQYGGNAVGTRQTKIFKNGSLVNAALSAGMAGPAGACTGYPVSREFLCSAGDVISIWGYQSSGGALNTNVGGSLNSYFEGQLVSLANP